jgi:hypothetical protein
MDKFEQRARKNKVDDVEANRIRKNIQTVCSNHATMYNKLKDFCTENDKLKKKLQMLQDGAIKLGIQKINLKVSTGVNTALTEESSSFKKLSLRPPTQGQRAKKIRQTKFMVEKPTQKKNPPNTIIGTKVNTNINNVQYVVQQMNNPSSSGYVMIQNNNPRDCIPVQVIFKKKIRNRVPLV